MALLVLVEGLTSLQFVVVVVSVVVVVVVVVVLVLVEYSACSRHECSYPSRMTHALTNRMNLHQEPRRVILPNHAQVLIS